MAQPADPRWREKILRGIGAPVTPENLRFEDAWARAEGGTAANNPFNTTLPAGGASAYNRVGVRNYVSPQQGIQATVDTLKNGRYGGIIAALRQGTSAGAAASALAASPWGTGSLVQKILGSPQPGTAATVPAAAPGAPREPQQPDGRRAFAAALLQAIGATGQLDNRGLLGALQTRRPPAPLQSAAPREPAVASAPASAGPVRSGIAEAFYDPLGSYDNGRFGGPIGGHSDHDHVSFSDPQAALRGIQLAQSLGLAVRENPYVDPVDPVHVNGSYHYQTFPGLFNGRRLGKAIDASGPAAAMASFYRQILGLGGS